MASQETLRFRSFAERYVIERAASFHGTEEEIMEQAWAAMLTARTMYEKIAGLGRHMKDEEEPQPGTQGAAANPGVTGAYGGPISPATAHAVKQRQHQLNAILAAGVVKAGGPSGMPPFASGGVVNQNQGARAKVKALVRGLTMSADRRTK